MSGYWTETMKLELHCRSLGCQLASKNSDLKSSRFPKRQALIQCAIHLAY